jgi:hypothetical protein
MSDDDFTKIGVRREDREDDAPYRRENYQVPTEITDTDHRVPHEEEVLDYPYLGAESGRSAQGSDLPAACP